VDNLRTGSLDNIAQLQESPRFAFLRHDVCQPLNVEADEIYNLACPASPVHYQSDPIQTLRTSVHGAFNLLELAQRTGARILQASTSEVYGDPHVHPQPESYWGHVNPVGLRACYDEGKRCAETLFADYRRQRGVKTRIARIFNTYGPRMQPDDGRVVSNFIVQALRGEPLTVYGDGAQTRSFCYVSDLVEALIRLMAANDIAAPVNIGNPQECTVLELADVIVQMTGSRSTIVFKPLPQDDPIRRCPDIAAAKRLLRWQPRVALREGLQRTIACFERRIGDRALDDAPRALSTGST
jgi:UDP-glucuronate decarboxylase